MYTITYMNREIGTTKTPGGAYRRVYALYRKQIDAGDFSWPALKIAPQN